MADAGTDKTGENNLPPLPPDATKPTDTQRPSACYDRDKMDKVDGVTEDLDLGDIDSGDEVDPRVQVELENLNTATGDINTLEAQLEVEGAAFRTLMTGAGQQLNQFHKRLGKCVNKARPYFEAVKEVRKSLTEAQEAAVKFQRANSVYKEAKDTVANVEKHQGQELKNDVDCRQFDSAWQEMLNHATMKFMESEVEKTRSEKLHFTKAAACSRAQQRLRVLEKSLNKSIPRARPYFELKEKLEAELQLQKQRVEALTKAVMSAKESYAGTLRRLEDISEEVHQRRKARRKLPPRTPGVGAEEQANMEEYDLDIEPPETPETLTKALSELGIKTAETINQNGQSQSNNEENQKAVDVPGGSKDNTSKEGTTVNQDEGKTKDEMKAPIQASDAKQTEDPEVEFDPELPPPIPQKDAKVYYTLGCKVDENR